jgi:hypothetical protein
LESLYFRKDSIIGVDLPNKGLSEFLRGLLRRWYWRFVDFHLRFDPEECNASILDPAFQFQNFGI